MEGLIPLMIRAFRARRKRSRYARLPESPTRWISGLDWNDSEDHRRNGDIDNSFIRRTTSEVHRGASHGFVDFRRYQYLQSPKNQGAGHRAAGAVAADLDSLRRTKSEVAR